MAKIGSLLLILLVLQTSLSVQAAPLPEPQPTYHGKTLTERIASLENDARQDVSHDTYLGICPDESCEVHGNSLVKGVAPVHYGLFKAIDEKGLALEEAG